MLFLELLTRLIFLIILNLSVHMLNSLRNDFLFPHWHSQVTEESVTLHHEKFFVSEVVKIVVRTRSVDHDAWNFSLVFILFVKEWKNPLEFLLLLSRLLFFHQVDVTGMLMTVIRVKMVFAYVRKMQQCFFDRVVVILLVLEHMLMH